MKDELICLTNKGAQSLILLFVSKINSFKKEGDFVILDYADNHFKICVEESLKEIRSEIKRLKNI